MNHDDYEHFGVSIPAAAAKPKTWRPYIDTHCLLVGGTSEDRASLVGAIAADLAAAGWTVRRGVSIEEQQEIITDTWKLMEHRFDQHMSDPTAREQWDPILLIVDDEFDSLTRRASTTDQIQDLVTLTRSARIHVLVSASSPPMSLLTGDLCDSIAVRVPVGQG